MEAGDLYEHCVKMIDRYRPLDTSADSHAHQYMKEHHVTSPEDKAFLLEVFGGYIRHRKVVDVVIDAFFNADGQRFVLSEKNVYTVACYCLIFRSEEMGPDKTTHFLVSQNWERMHCFCNFFINKKNLLTWIRDEWRKIYEEDYINESLLGPIIDNFDTLDGITKLLNQLFTEDAQPRARIVKREVTVPEPFELTQPKPRKIPSPEVIPKVKPVKPVPSSTYEVPNEDRKLAEIRERNKQKAQENLMRANQVQFSCAAAAKASRESTERSVEIDIAQNYIKAKPAPSFTKANDVPVKLNTAAILREEKLFKAKEEEMINKLENLQAGAKDASDFNQWQEEMRKKDYEKDLADIERRRLEGLLSHEEAILAQKRVQEVNREIANQLKEDAAQRMREFVAMKLKEDEETRKLVEQVVTGHKNAKQAVKKIQDIKQKLAQQMNAESKELLRKAFEEAEAEMAQKQEIIRQIRAIESVPRPRNKAFDPTELVGYGFFGEMSLAELRERLNLAKIKQEKEQADRRDQILKDKQEKEQSILDAMDTINRHRSEQTRAAAIRLEEKRRTQQQEEQKFKTNDPEVARLQQVLEQKRQERMNRQAAEKSAPAISAVRMNDLAREKKSVEAGRFQSLEDGNENLVKKQSMGFSSRASRIAIG